jgi:uncharacterized protein YmfQ (DUF2313 family)
MLAALLPLGPAWAAEGASADARAMHHVLAALAFEYARLDARAQEALDEMDPATIRALIPEWEHVMGLPDPCLGPAPSFEVRQKAVRERLLRIGGQHRTYFLHMARRQGYNHARITEHRAPRHGRAHFGAARLGTWRQQFCWTLHLGHRMKAGRRWGVTLWSERFGQNPHAAMECLVRRAAPAHSMVLFDYGE